VKTLELFQELIDLQVIKVDNASTIKVEGLRDAAHNEGVIDACLGTPFLGEIIKHVEFSK